MLNLLRQIMLQLLAECFQIAGRIEAVLGLQVGYASGIHGISRQLHLVLFSRRTGKQDARGLQAAPAQVEKLLNGRGSGLLRSYVKVARCLRHGGVLLTLFMIGQG